MRKIRGRVAAEEVEEMRRIVDEINLLCRDGSVILVEGLGDVEVLKEAGVEGEILTLEQFRRRVAAMGVVNVLTLIDLDREGERIYSRLIRRFTDVVRFDDRLRRTLMTTKRYRRGLRSVEQLFRL